MISSGLVRYHRSLIPLFVEIDEVRPHPENYNNGDVEKIIESIERHGMYRPVQVQRSTNHIVVGNHTWEACKALDAIVIPVVWMDVDDDQARAMMIDDNEIARLAIPDPAAELALLNQLAQSEHGLPVAVDEQRHEQLRALAEIPLEAAEFAQWPTVCFQVPPNVRAAFYRMTSEARDDRERFEVLMRLAGWDGR